MSNNHQDVRQNVGFSTGQFQKSYVAWGLVLIVFLIGYNMPSKTVPKAPTNDFQGFTLCDRLAKQQVKNPSSYQSSSKVDATRDGNFNVFRRNFTAMNDFGGTIDYWYLCKFDTVSKMGSLMEINRGNYR